MNLLADITAPADSDLAWQPGFSALGPTFFTEVRPTPLPQPHWLASSTSVAQLLRLSPQWLHSDTALQALAGNTLLPGSTPLASVYSGHQFGVWAGQLGDGRAILLGETTSGFEIQLKGAGRTPYSRGGDGRAVLRSSIREFLCNEAMHALGVPTTRALALIGSPQPVQRETVETAAVVTRVAPSFVRFGHFEHFGRSSTQEQLRCLADYVIAREYPECTQAEVNARFAGNPYAALLYAVSQRTAKLMGHWQSIGFCHGVMNTDNMSIGGLTIDYGPFQFLDAYVPGHVCNHSDHQGRYAFQNQPKIAHWNLFCLAQSLMPLILDKDLALAALEDFPQLYVNAYLERMRAKLGLSGLNLETTSDQSADVIDKLLTLLSTHGVDYPIFWRRLSHAVSSNDFEPVRDLMPDRDAWDAWLLTYSELLAQTDRVLAADLMLKTNPKFVLRNHLGEQAIAAAHNGDYSVLHTLQNLLERPFDEHPGHDAYADFPPEWASSISISCSS